MEFREVGKIQREIVVLRPVSRTPGEPGIEIHHGIERAGFAHGGEKSDGVDAQDACIDGEGSAVGREIAEDDIVRIEILRDMQHGGAAQFGVRRAGRRGPSRPDGPSCEKTCCPAVESRLDGEFFEAFANPVQAGRGSGVFKRKDEEDAAWRQQGARAGDGRSGLQPCAAEGKRKKRPLHRMREACGAIAAVFP